MGDAREDCVVDTEETLALFARGRGAWNEWADAKRVERAQNLYSAVLIFLFLLAVRNHFRIK